MTMGILSLSDLCLYPPYPGNEAASVLESTPAQGVFGSGPKCEGSQLHNLQTDVAKVGICVLRMQIVFPKKKHQILEKANKHKLSSKGNYRFSPNMAS